MSGVDMPVESTGFVDPLRTIDRVRAARLMIAVALDSPEQFQLTFAEILSDDFGELGVGSIRNVFLVMANDLTALMLRDVQAEVLVDYMREKVAEMLQELDEGVT